MRGSWHFENLHLTSDYPVFSHVVNRFYPCRLGISPDDAKYWWLRFVLSDEAGQFSLLYLLI